MWRFSHLATVTVLGSLGFLCVYVMWISILKSGECSGLKEGFSPQVHLKEPSNWDVLDALLWSIWSNAAWSLQPPIWNMALMSRCLSHIGLVVNNCCLSSRFRKFFFWNQLQTIIPSRRGTQTPRPQGKLVIYLRIHTQWTTWFLL